MLGINKRLEKIQNDKHESKTKKRLPPMISYFEEKKVGKRKTKKV